MTGTEVFFKGYLLGMVIEVRLFLAGATTIEQPFVGEQAQPRVRHQQGRFEQGKGD
jgi:hypothetical protein